MTPFWMVCRSPRHAGSKTEPTHRYATKADAMREAKALANQTGAPFVILEATETVWPDGDQERLL